MGMPIIGGAPGMPPGGGIIGMPGRIGMPGGIIGIIGIIGIPATAQGGSAARRLSSARCHTRSTEGHSREEGAAPGIGGRMGGAIP